MGSSTAVVLAGGASTRFGSDKTAALVDGVTLLDRVVDVARTVTDDVLVVGPRAPSGCRQVLEPSPRRGPLGGLAHGLAHVDSPVALVLAADHPNLRPELLAALLARLVDGDASAASRARAEAEGRGAVDAADTGVAARVDAVVPMRDGRPEPLVAAYRTRVGLVAEQVLAEGGRSMRALLDRLRVDWWAEEDWRRLDPPGSSFEDVDEPGDLDRWR